MTGVLQRKGILCQVQCREELMPVVPAITSALELVLVAQM